MTSQPHHMPAPEPLPQLIALDMDGTLLDGEGRIPEDFWPIVDRATAAGIVIAPASGRQLATLRELFDRPGAPDSFIAENGTVIFHQGRSHRVACLDQSAVDAALAVPAPAVPVVCLAEQALVPAQATTDQREEISHYYAAVSYIDDSFAQRAAAAAEAGDVVKIAVLSFNAAEQTVAPLLAERLDSRRATVAVSGKDWADIMPAGTNKGTALASLARQLGISVQRTAAFGDYLNDYELLEAAGTAVAMANAHPKLRDIADIIAPANTDGGVVRVLTHWLGGGRPPAGEQPRGAS